LAMALIDKNYDGKVFNMSECVFAENIKDGNILFNFENVGEELMVIYIDVYGNEFRETLQREAFRN